MPSLSPTDYSKVGVESPLMPAEHSQLGSRGSRGTGLGEPRSSYGLDGWASVGDIRSPGRAFGRQDGLLRSSCFLPALSPPLGWKMKWPYNHLPPPWSPAQNPSPIETGNTCFGLTFGPRCRPLLCGTETQGLPLAEARCPAPWMLATIPASWETELSG